MSKNINNVRTIKKFSFQDVVNESDDYLINQIRKELPKKRLRNGSEVRISTLKTLCDLIEKNNKKLDTIYSKILEVKSCFQK